LKGLFMTRPNVLVQQRKIADTLRRYGADYANPFVILGYDVNGNSCIRFDFTAQTWASGNRMVIVRANSLSVGGITMPAAGITPSVATGQYSDGVFSYDVFMEDVPLTAGTVINEKFMADFLHVIRGNQFNSCAFYKTASGTEPKLNGFNGATADVIGTFIGNLLPASRIAAPGYGS
jgi:hypothetical protein